MRVVVCPELGPLSNVFIEERADLEPGPGKVVVDVAAAGVNFVDGLICLGGYQIKPPTPFTPGMEIAGTVRAVGAGVDELAVGDRVMAMTGFGAFASQVEAHPASLVRVPDEIDLGRAATLIQSYATALYTLARRTSLAEGEWVLVLGAGGGIGLATVDVAKGMGAKVIAAASSADKLAAAVAMGADATIEYESEDLKVRARELSGGGVDVVVDPVGGKHSEPALRALGKFGRFCVVGFAGGSIPSVPLNQVLLSNRTMVGVDWGGWAFGDADGNNALIGEMVVMAAEGRIHPTQPAEHPLEDAAAVMQGLLDRRIAGKVVLVP